MRDQRLWTWHVAAGAIILVLLGLHMTMMHLARVVPLASSIPLGGKPIDWPNVAARAKSTGFFVMYVVLLGAALFHGLYGLRNILCELNPGVGLRKLLTGLLVVAGVALFVFGAWAAWAAWAGITVALGA